MTDLRETIDHIYRTEARRVFATLVRLVGDFDLAEDVMQEAFAAALNQWQREGIPKNPAAWLISVGKFKAVDVIRRKKRLDEKKSDLAEQLLPSIESIEDLDEAQFQDDQLRLIFTCCHPALSSDTQVALTLREVCGLTTEEVARAFLVPHTTIAQRIVRGKAKIREAKIPYIIPKHNDLPDRLDSVLSVIYLVFNEGYSASFGDNVTRHDLSSEAIHLARMLLELLPDTEVMGLLALMLLHDSRRQARIDPDGDIILLEDQDRSIWNRDQITEGIGLVERALSSGRFGAYTLQAAIAAVHAEAESPKQTDWEQIVALYDVLLRAVSSPVIELNRAVAVAMRDGAAAGLLLVDEILSRGDLSDYHLAYSAKADLCRRLGKMEEARSAYQHALSLTKQEPERRFLQKRLQDIL